MSLFTKTRETLLTMIGIFNLQVRSSKTCNSNVLNQLNVLDMNRKPTVTRFCRKVETNIKFEDIRPLEEFSSRSFRKLAMEHQADTFKLNGFISPVSSLGVYNQNPSLYPFVSNWRWYVTTKDQGGPVKQSGGGLGKLDAKGEAGFFHKVNLSRLEQIKKMLKEKQMMQQNEAPKDDTDAKK